jgi:hypothetical protein
MKKINRSKAAPFHCIGKALVALTNVERGMLINAMLRTTAPTQQARIKLINKLERAKVL